MKRIWIIPVVVAVLVVAALAAWRNLKLKEFFSTQYPELDGGTYDQSLSKDGLSYLVPPSQVYDSGLGANGVPALNDPEYIDVYAADEFLADEIFGLDVEAGGVHYFYPFQIMNWHEVVNDTLNDVPLAITYSTLCGTPIVYERTVAGAEVNFSVSGKIYNSASLLTDGSSETLWNQATGEAIVGLEVGQMLTRYPSVVMPWRVFKDEFENGLVLSNITGYDREYGRHPYGGYETAPFIYFPVNHLNDRQQPKEIVFDVTNGEDHIAYSIKNLGFQTEPNITLGEGKTALNVVAFMDIETKVTRVFNRSLDGQVLSFIRDSENPDQFKDHETGSIWNQEGQAVRGKLRGTQLTQLIAPPAYAFCYSAMYPDAWVSGDEIFDWDGDGIQEGRDEGPTKKAVNEEPLQLTE